MKKYIAPLLLLLVLGIACKKSKDPVYTSMTLYVSGDSTWTITNVTADRQSDGSVIIKGNNTDKGESIMLILVEYREGRKTYYIGSGSVPGYSYGSAATYDYSGYTTEAYIGQIAITNVATHTIDGTFDFSTNKARVTGHFKAPIP